MIIIFRKISQDIRRASGARFLLSRGRRQLGNGLLATEITDAAFHHRFARSIRLLSSGFVGLDYCIAQWG